MDIEKLYRHSIENRDTELIDSYLESRHLKPNTEIGSRFYKGNTYLTIPIYNSKSQLIAIEQRDIIQKQYIKTPLPDYKGYLIYNIQNAIHNLDYIVLTEGIFDCMALTQNNINSISGLRASIPEGMIHLLTLWNRIVVAYDNDEVGREQTKRISDYLYKYYSKEVITLDYYSHDINDALISGELPDIIDQIKTEVEL